ncbi:Hypp3066 [Branchiostoma lanceolatum]|uniref:Hypp3066 protein n=1 Tax=Branchiostoma lanceolatum TaxID=7740 RepID=A0A8J9ZZ74_BRALA|nr:Hypp3066 [Branchiostoma lanceolatum]
MPAGLDPGDYTDVKFLLDFAPPINFTEMVSKSLDQRQYLENIIQSMVYNSFSAEVAATVANIWPKGFGISFTVHKDPHRNGINMTAMAEEFHANWASGSVGLDILRLGVTMKPPGFSYERGFWSVCEEDCSQLVSEDSCVSVPSCDWCTLSEGPECGDNCYLEEREYEFSVFCPCLLEHKGLEQQLQDSFRDQVQQLLRGRFGGWNSTKPMYSINTTGSIITFSLKSSMQQRITPDVIDFLRKDSNWNGVTINDGFNQYEIMEPTGYTDVDVIVEFNNVDFTNLVGQYSISVDGLRFALNTTLTSIGVSPDCVASTRILRRGRNVLEFSMSRALGSTVNLTAEVNKLVEANRNGEFNLNLRPGWPVSKSVSKTETFDSICPSVDLWATTDTVYPPGMCPCPTEGSISLVYEDQAASAGLSTPDKLGLAVGLPIAVAALSALGVLLMFYFKKKGSNRPPTAFRRTAVSPAVQSFETNIYSASIDDNLSHQFGKKGSQLNRFRDPDAVYGRLSYSPPPSTASSTLTSEMSLPGSPDYFY